MPAPSASSSPPGFVVERHAGDDRARDRRRSAVEADLRPLAADEVLATADLAWAIGDRHDEDYRALPVATRRVASRARRARHARASGARSIDDAARREPRARRSRHRRRGVVRSARRSRSLPGCPDRPGAPRARTRERAARRLGRRCIRAGIATVVIVAAPASEAARVYERVGFATAEHTVSACLYPVSDPRRPMTES